SEGRRAWIAPGAVLGALVVFFKVQVFAAAFPLLFSFAVVVWPPRKRWRWLVLAVCVMAGLALLPLADRFYVEPDVRFDFSGSNWYWKTLANMARATSVEGWYQVFRVGQPFPSHLALAIALLLVNALGIFIVIAPLVWLLAAWRKTWQTSDWISVAAVAILLLMTFGIGRNGTSDNAYEFIQHPFIWAYWLVGALTAGRLFSMVTERYLRFATAIVIVGIAAFMLVPARYGSGLQPGKRPGAKAYSSLRVDRGLVECAHYIQSQPPTNAVTQDSHQDKLLILGGLSERPSFAARLEIWKRASKAFRESSYKAQLQKLQSLQEATSIPALQRSVRETGIRWYLLHPGDSNVWPAEFRDHPLFESNGYRVYDMQRCFNLGS
ncbi:MAG TPA: hypothetical protein VE133_00020, partial [Candidatus Sulfotelmatobacter sp.]|nr:hypothetical protein [Candidatus Sulfotelmatobacter sp.]